jgi:hypothetical protein
MMSCEEARKLLYEIETGMEQTSVFSDPLSILALAKAHLLVCVACSDYFERERAFTATITDHIQTFITPIPALVVSNIFDSISKARTNEYKDHEPTNRKGFTAWFKRLFT